MSIPALVLVHGYPFDHTLWDPVVALLKPTVKVMAPDLRGFGGQTIGPDEPSLDRMADDLERLLDQNEMERAVIAGMSMGGYVALAFAEHYPERLAGLALISSQALADSEETRANRRAMIVKVRREGPAVAAQAVLPKLFGAGNSTKPEFTRFATIGAAGAGVEGIAWALEAMARRPDRTALLKSLRIPVLLVQGDADQLIPVERAREMAKLPVDMRYVEIHGAGHATPIEAPTQVADGLLDLVKRSYGPDSI
jgi:pimeloyl-ACP methyl ester carboxylesterase